ncbi:O-methyltransferase [Gallaecimonas mangrovi]|uniref:O-methyltransferase n=1 Tax=Gallaecimonas mangrovi TaxID=2291597 RepID=UPI000E1FF63E|nr:class I SAM-dependent methyltransferase [Gallaecimonas mangrovi]
MNTLKTLTPLLDTLYAEAAAVEWPDDALALTAEQQQQLMHSKTDYLALYSRLKEQPLPVARDTGQLLYMLARSSQANTIVEYGTSFGLSTLHLAAALKDNGGGLLITTEFESSKVIKARANLVQAGVNDLVQIREGDALQTLATDLPASIDLVLLDGAKALYKDILDLLAPRLRPGALIVADDVHHCPEYITKVRDPASGYLSIALPDDVELTVKTF